MTCNRLCRCGCGASLCDAHPQAFYHTRKCRRRAKYQRSADGRSLPGQFTRVPMATAADPVRAPQKLCQVCFGCSWRRPLWGCDGCGLPYAAERVVAR